MCNSTLEKLEAGSNNNSELMNLELRPRIQYFPSPSLAMADLACELFEDGVEMTR